MDKYYDNCDAYIGEVSIKCESFSYGSPITYNCFLYGQST